MIFLENILSPLQNCEETAFHLCDALKLPLTKTTLVNSLLEHPDYPSLLCMSDVLQNYGVENVSMRLNEPQKITQLQTPFVAQVIGDKSHSAYFAVIYSASSELVEWRNPETHKKERIPYDTFDKFFTNYVQVYGTNADAGEKEFGSNLKKEKTTNLVNSLIALSIPALTLIISILLFYINGIKALFPVLYLLVLLVGVITGALLILYEIDQYNPTLQKVCTGGAKTNCAAILHSKGSKIFGIHWSIIGFSYFMGVLAVLLASCLLHLQMFTAAAWINVLVLPYTIYSIYYQARIAKQWCPMCLTVQMVLIMLFIISVVGKLLSTTSFSFQNFAPYIVIIIVVFLAAYLLLPALEKAKSSKLYLQSLQRLKHNPQIFEALLAKQKKITESTEGLGITLGNPEGKIHLIKVCNPYCGPCANAHPVIDELLANNPDIKLQIIFTATESEEDYRNKPVKAFLILQKNKHILSEALDRWYLSDEKDYNKFEKQYSLSSDELNKQLTAVKAMREWCDATKIEFTPTFFINNHQLPELYSVADLQYFLSV